MKKNLLLIFLLLIAYILFGCHRNQANPAQPLTRVVTEITISYGGETHRYSSADSVEAILSYLRLLNPHGKPVVDPTEDNGTTYDITVTYSDGYQTHYQQKDNRFFLDKDGQWKNIDEKKALGLSKLFHLLVSDNV